ncbi:MAG: glycosyltransferase [Melioribacteraceae bacterium]|nr:glycosyltransferase [Melioribacteraceae bacterium]
MFKVLVLAYYFPPMGLSGVQRTLKFTKYMKQFNWEPTVITCGNTGYFAHDYSLLKEAEDAGIRIIRTESFDPNSLLKKYGTITMPREIVRKTLSKISKTVLIPDNKISWANKAYKKAKELLQTEKYDAIFTTIPPYSSFVSAAKLKQEFGIPLFVDYRDLWYGNHFAFYPTPYHRVKHKKLEANSLRLCDKTIVVNRKIKEKLLEYYPFLKHDDVVIISHGYDSADFENLVKLPKTNKKMQLTYSGIFYEMITPKYFLKAFKEITKERPDIAANIELNFIGHFRKENHKLVKKLGLQQFVKDHGYMDHKEMLRRLVMSDVLWMMIGKSKNTDTVTAGKLFEYFGTRKPIIVSVPEGASKFNANEYGASFITEPDNITEIKEAIIKVHTLYKAGELPKPNEEFIESLDRKNLTERLTTEFQFFIKEEVLI